MKTITTIVLALTLLAACSSEDVLTEEERRIQDAADGQVALVLFGHNLTAMASYKVRKNGSVVIKFDKSVPAKKYQKVVQSLRASSSIKSVYAEQEGKEVCTLSR